jgi:hypothetical protein
VDIETAIAELRKRNEPVPEPLRLPSAAEVEAAEQQIGLAFPPAYRRYLLEASDVVFGMFEPAIAIPDAGSLDLATVAREAWEQGVKRDRLAFCEDNGDYYCLAPDGSVRFWSHDGATNERWPDLGTWIVDVWIGESEASEADSG